jgi:hypothetical protein
VPGEPKARESVLCKSPEGRLVATVEIFASDKQALGADEHPLVVLTAEEALRFAEEPIQLRERNRYEYRLVPSDLEAGDLRLLAARGIQPSLDPPPEVIVD